MANKPDWDPYLICLQIVCIQCSYYLFYGLVLLACHLVFGTDLSLAHFFTAKMSLRARGSTDA